MVPGSTLRYGSNFCRRTRRPRCSSNMPTEALVKPLPRELTTPPVTKICLATLNVLEMTKEGTDQLYATGEAWSRCPTRLHKALVIRRRVHAAMGFVDQAHLNRTAQA